MYTLSKAKSEIDLVAKHATDIAGHLITMGGAIDDKLEAFKTEILAAIDAKFAEALRSIHGEEDVGDGSALLNLGTQVSLLSQGGATQVPADVLDERSDAALDGASEQTETDHSDRPSQPEEAHGYTYGDHDQGHHG